MYISRHIYAYVHTYIRT
uniref:Uncharacterized protein n=1 Tax=Arundo donax TaxID=35708 RepID=A0A0A8Y3Z9_ARUDO